MKAKRINKASALVLARAIFGDEACVTARRTTSSTPGRYFETVYALHSSRTSKELGRSLFGFREALGRAVDTKPDVVLDTAEARSACAIIGTPHPRPLRTPDEVQVHVVVAVTLRDGAPVKLEVADGGGPWAYSDRPQVYAPDEEEGTDAGWRSPTEHEELEAEGAIEAAAQAAKLTGGEE